MTIKKKFIKPNNIGFDFDGVIANTVNLIIYIAKTEYNINIRYNDITDYDFTKCLNIDISQELVEEVVKKIISGDYSKLLEPIEGAPKTLKAISQKSEKLLIVTARPSTSNLSQWLIDKLFLDKNAINLYATGSFEAKAEILLSQNIKYFVEDRFETCIFLKKHGIEPILFAQPWNRNWNRNWDRKKNPIIEVKSWDDLENLIIF